MKVSSGDSSRRRTGLVACLLFGCAMAFAFSAPAAVGADRSFADPEAPMRYPGPLTPFDALAAGDSGPSARPFGAARLDSAALDSILTKAMTDYHIAGLAACVVKDGRVAWREPFGHADVAAQIPVTNETIFMLASISKTFVATALLQLYEDGLLDLDADINGYLPFTVVHPYHPGVAITARMLMAHVSSIRYNADVWLPLIT
jgi:CubicO group peptidase (beta-lactamase class C family)